MLKIKNNIDLKELEKFGFYLEGNTYKYDLLLGKCVYICTIPSLNRTLIFPPFEWYEYLFFKKKKIKRIESIQQKLIRAGLVEKVSD